MQFHYWIGFAFKAIVKWCKCQLNSNSGPNTEKIAHLGDGGTLDPWFVGPLPKGTGRCWSGGSGASAKGRELVVISGSLKDYINHFD